MWVCLISGQLKNMQRTRGPTDMTLSSWSRICICHLQKCQCFNRGQVSQEKRECVHWIWQKDRKVSFKRVQTKEYEWEQGDNSENVCVSFVLYLASSHLTRPYEYINNRSKVLYKDLLNMLKRGLICSPRLHLFSYLKTEIFWILLLDSCFSLDSNAFLFCLHSNRCHLIMALTLLLTEIPPDKGVIKYEHLCICRPWQMALNSVCWLV